MATTPTREVSGVVADAIERQDVVTDDKHVRGNIFVNFLVRFPCLAATLIMGLCLVTVMGTSVAIGEKGAEIFASGSSKDIHDIRSIQAEGFKMATKEALAFGGQDDEDSSGMTYPQQTQSADVLQLLFLAKDGDNVFTEANLVNIKAIEDKVVGNTNFTDFCRRNDASGQSSSCKQPVSPLNLFYASGIDLKNVTTGIDAFDGRLDGSLDAFSTVDLSEDLSKIHRVFTECILSGKGMNFCRTSIAQMKPPPSGNASFIYQAMLPLVASMTQPRGSQLQDVQATLKLASHMKTVGFYAPYVDYFFDKGFTVQRPKSQHTRSIIEFGLPLAGFKNKEDKKDEQTDLFSKWFRAEFNDYFKATHEVGNVEALFFSSVLVRDEFLSILVNDAIKVLISLGLVFAWIWFQTGSCFIATAGILEIALSIPCAFFFYYTVFGIKYFDGLNAMTVFIVAAIGADDIFVFMDQYKLSAYKPEVCKDLRTRMNWVYSRASWAMLITSATTCAAFVCSATSPLPSIQSFGIFSAFVIVADYVLVITWFPACVVLYHNYIENRPCCLLFCWWRKMFPCTWRMERSTDAARAIDKSEEPKKRALERCMSGPFTSVLNRGAPIIVVAFALLLIPTGYLASTVKPLTTAEESLPSDHPFQRIWTISGEEFPNSARTKNTPVHLVWGVGGVNLDGVNTLLDGQTRKGLLEWDPAFKFDAAAQQHIWNVCQEAHRLQVPGLESFISRDADAEGNPGQVDCPLDAWKSWLDRPGGPGFPLALEKVSQEMTMFLNSTVTNRFGQNMTMREKIGERLAFDDGYEGGIVRMVAVEVGSQIPLEGFHSPDFLRSNYDSFEAWVEEINSAKGRLPAPTSANNVFQTADGSRNGPQWVWMHTQSLFRSSAILGAVMGSSLAFVVILCATQQIIIALASLVSIVSVLSSVLACMVLAGYELGTITSICITILAGFAVDYVVHLAHAYNHSSKSTRSEKFQEAFEVIGVSVLSGMITSILAAAVLLTCSLQFFAKFGFFLIVTVVWAWLWGNCFFMCLLRLVGPDDSTHWLLQMPHSIMPRSLTACTRGKTKQIEATTDGSALPVLVGTEKEAPEKAPNSNDADSSV